MFNDILGEIGGIHIYPVVSLILFVAVFAAVLIRVARMDRIAAQQLAALPLEQSDIITANERTVSR